MKRSVSHSRGQASLLVLVLIGLLGTFVAGATMLQRPAGQTLDLQMAFDNAQFAADSSIQQSLANLEIERTADVSLEHEGTSGRSTLSAEGDQFVITASGSAPAPKVDSSGTERVAWVSIRVMAAKGDTGKWRIGRYEILDSRLEVQK